MAELVESFCFHSNQHANKRQTGTYICTLFVFANDNQIREAEILNNSHRISCLASRVLNVIKLKQNKVGNVFVL